MENTEYSWFYIGSILKSKDKYFFYIITSIFIKYDTWFHVKYILKIFHHLRKSFKIVFKHDSTYKER